MGERWLISDTHFGHKGIVTFQNDDGTPTRPWDDVGEMDEALVENWNSVVAPNDKVYHLGDVVINRHCLPILERLNGKKRLVMGNHDIFRAREYMQYFDDLHGALVRTIKGHGNVIMTHIPIHPGSKGRFISNVHGHLHANKYDDPWYINIAVERINYTPIHWDEIVERIIQNIQEKENEIR